jgi:hypothetical protein
MGLPSQPHHAAVLGVVQQAPSSPIRSTLRTYIHDIDVMCST